MLNDTSLVVAILGLFGVLFGLRQAYRARLRQFEDKYIERYWSILDKLSLEALSLAEQDPKRSDEEAIRRYILLCEDELQARANGYISDATYFEWADGMLDQFKQPMFKEIWGKVYSEIMAGAPGEFPYDNLRILLEERNPRKDDPALRRHPVRLSMPARAVRGLKGISGACAVTTEPFLEDLEAVPRQLKAPGPG
jgi:hypothetical protein